jgi:hypothetical protein
MKRGPWWRKSWPPETADVADRRVVVLSSPGARTPYRGDLRRSRPVSRGQKRRAWDSNPRGMSPPLMVFKSIRSSAPATAATCLSVPCDGSPTKIIRAYPARSRHRKSARFLTWLQEVGVPVNDPPCPSSRRNRCVTRSRVKHGLRGCPDGGSCGPVGIRLGSAGKLPHNRLGSIERGPGAGPPEHDGWSVSARRVTVVDLICLHVNCTASTGLSSLFACGVGALLAVRGRG